MIAIELRPGLHVARLVALALAIQSCKRATRVEPAARSSVPASIAPSAPANPALDGPSELERLCRSLRDGMSFKECNDPARSQDFPDCRQLSLSAPDALTPGGCPPRQIALSVTGYPGIAQSFELEASVDQQRPHRFRLLLERELPPSPARLAPGTLMATLRLLPLKGSELAPGPGLAPYTTKLAILEDRE